MPTSRRSAGRARAGRSRPAEAPGARCAHFPDCVGCPWMGRPYGVQLAEKHERLRRALVPLASPRSFRLALPSGSPERFGYRNHAKLVFRSRRTRQGPEVLLGVYRPGTHSVMPADACAVHDPLLQPLLRDLPRLAGEHRVPIFDERRGEGDLRYALARCSRLTRRVHLTLVSARDDAPWMSRLVEDLRGRHPSLESVFVSLNPHPGNALLRGDVRPLVGPPALLERVGTLLLESRTGAFLQANPSVAANLYRAAERAARVPPGGRVLDLYCGVGAIGLSVAGPEDRLLGIEAAPAAVACARRNARRAGARRARFAEGAAEDLAEIAAREGLGTPDLAAVNPPRKGLGTRVVEQLAALGPRQILYVSCDPETLARDVGGLVARGYRLDRAQAFDMLPQTPHVEALAVLSRTGGDPHDGDGHRDRAAGGGDVAPPRRAGRGRVTRRR